MRSPVSFFILIASLLVPQMVAAQVRMNQDVTVQGEQVTLGDLADLSSLSEENQQRLGKIVIISSLRPGQERTLSARSISQFLREGMQSVGLIGEDRPLFRVPDELTVRRGIALTAKSFEDRLKLTLATKCKDCRIEIQEARIPHEALAAKCNLWSFDTKSIQPQGTFIVDLELSCETKTSYKVPVKISLFQRGVVSRTALPANYILTSTDIAEQWIDITHARSTVVQAQEAIGRKTRRHLSMSSPIFDADFVKQFDVLRGQVTRVLIGRGPLEVSTQAIAEQDGVVGDLVRLRHPGTRKILSGYIESTGQVRIQ